MGRGYTTGEEWSGLLMKIYNSTNMGYSYVRALRNDPKGVAGQFREAVRNYEV